VVPKKATGQCLKTIVFCISVVPVVRNRATYAFQDNCV